MNNERTVVLENVANQPVGLKDTQNRTYRFGIGGRIRISEVSLQDILDYPASRIIFKEGMMKISNINPKILYNMGLSEDEIKLFVSENNEYTEEKEEEIKPEVIEKIKPEVIEEIKEEVIEEIKEEEPVIEKPEAKIEVEETKEEPEIKKPTRKTTTKKTTKKSSSKKKK